MKDKNKPSDERYLTNNSSNYTKEPSVVYAQEKETLSNIYLKPDEDFHRAISFEEFEEGAKRHIHQLFANKR